MSGENYIPPEAVGAEEFDSEKEKEHRKEIRKILAEAISEILVPAGFKKEGYSIWRKKIPKGEGILYLQRSSFSHSYMIELGIYDRAKAKEKGKEVEKPAIEDCQTRERLEYVIAKEKGEDPSSPKSKGRKIILDFQEKLNFEQPGADKKYPGEYFLPSVSLEEAKKKIEFIKSSVKEYALSWFTVQEKNLSGIV